jgi:translation initiation factor 4E
MSDFQDNIFAQQMTNPQQSLSMMNPQISQNEMMANLNQIQNNNQNHLYPFQQQQLNQNQNFNPNNFNNMNMNQNMNINNNNPNQNINNMNRINLNFDDLNENFLNQNKIQNPNNMNQNINQNNISDVKPQQEEKQSLQEEPKIDNNNANNSIPSSKSNKEEAQLTPNKKLENKFSFLYRIDDNTQNQNQKQVMEKEKYESQVKKIAEFDTIEEFWGIFQHLRKPDSCRPGIEYFMFKEPIKPMWEDENNKNGGRFSIKLKHGYTTIIWEEMIFALIGGILPKEMKDEINGIVVTSRKEFNTLQIWFKNYDDKITEDLEQCIRDLLVIPQEVKIEKRQFNKKDYGNNNINNNTNNSNNNKNNNNNSNKSGGYHYRGYNNYDNGGHGNYYKEHKKNKHQSNRKNN